MSIFSCLDPTPSDTTIILPYNSSKGKFDQTLYSPAMTEGRAPYEEIDRVLSALEVVARGLSHSDGFKNWFRKLLIPFLVVVWLLYMGTFHHNSAVFIGMFAWFYLIAGSLVFCIFQSLKSDKARQDAEAILEWYAESFKQRGLRWCIPEDFPHWVEIEKDYMHCRQISEDSEAGLLKKNGQVSIQMTQVESMDKPLIKK